MSEIVYINDPRGGRIPLTDEFGNLSIEAMFLYNEGKLPEDDRAKVDAIVANDEMAKDALEGYALMSSAAKAKAIVGDIGHDISSGKRVKRTAVVPLISGRTWAIAASLAVVIGIGSILVSRTMNKEQLAQNTESSLPVKEETSTVEKPSRPDFNLATDTITADTRPLEVETKTIAPNETVGTGSGESRGSESDQKKSVAEEQSKDLMAKIAALKAKQEGLNTPTPVHENAQHDAVAMDISEPAPTRVSNEVALEDDSSISASMESENNRNLRGAKAKQAEQVVDSYTDAFEYFNFNEVQNKPIFPGGDVKMWEYLETNKRHSEELKAKKIGGEVFVSFIINEKGKITNVEILTSKVGSPALEEDAKRLIRSMPVWTPGQMAGNPVKVKKTMMVKYPVD